MEHEEAFSRLTEDLDPYHEFLLYGRTHAIVDDPEEWRAEMRRQARRDKLRMSSFELAWGDGRYFVWAEKMDKSSPDDLRERFLLVDLQTEAEGRSLLLGHRRIVWLRIDRGEQAAGRCARCGSWIYVSRLETAPFISGEIFDGECRLH